MRCFMVIAFISLQYAVHGESNFAAVIYEKFGFSDGQNLLLSSDNLTQLSQQVLNGHTYNTQATVCTDRNCSTNVCYSPAIIYGDDRPLALSDFPSACPRLLYSLTQDCIKSDVQRSAHDKKAEKTKPPALSVWGYGLLFVTLINLCSLAGIFVLPLMKSEYYSTLLTFLIALAVGSLCANGILVLIPEAFEIIEIEGYTWRACSIIGGIYLFFITERVLKMITDHFVRQKNETDDGGNRCDIVGSIPTQTYLEFDRPMDPPAIKAAHDPDQTLSALLEHKDGDHNGDVPYANGNGHVKIQSDKTETATKKPVATVAWMIIFGDAFHNFIDGLSIGAAFSDSTMLGVSICIAVLCEELPHELGDFAILLNAGMSKKKALLFNFLSACTCYLGLIIGITLSEVAHATPWILGVAGGMFLYISLADMMPEMNRAAEEHKDRPFRIFFIQNCGFLFGVGVILLVSYFGAKIAL